MKKFKTGIVTVDSQLKGGIPEGSVVLVLEDPGAGGSVFACHFAVEGAKNEESILYVTTDDPAEYVLEDLVKMAEDEKIIENIHILDFITGKLHASSQKDALKKRYDPFNALRNILIERVYDRIIINNLTYFFMHYRAEDVLKLIESFSIYARKNNSVFLMIMTKGMFESRIETSVKHLSDGVIEMSIREMENEIQRRFKFIKFKRTLVPKVILRYDITDNGIKMESVMRVL